MSPSHTPYRPRRVARSVHVPLRGLNYHAHVWGDDSLCRPDRPPLLMLHGWMDVGASFQFVVDALQEERLVIAPDWRGFGHTRGSEAPDTYWFPDYLADLDALLDAPELGLGSSLTVDLCGHSMGGNVAMTYAGVRAQRVRRLINLEGFGLPAAQAHHAPRRLQQWLDELKIPQRLKSYADAAAVVERLRQNNPRLSPDKAAWLAPHWAQPAADGSWHILGDPAHKRANPILYRKDETVEGWRLIQAPTLWVEGADTDVARFWGDRYPRADFEARMAVVPQCRRAVLSDCGHMLHHDQPVMLAQLLDDFLA